jgi:hypothetical protein
MAQAYVKVLRVTVMLFGSVLVWACTSTATSTSDTVPGWAFLNFAWKPCDVVSPPARQEYPDRPPYGADELWSRVLLLVNEHDGYVSPERFAEVLGAHFGAIDHYREGASCRVRPRKDWYFSGAVFVYTKPFKVPGTADVDHSAWSMTWGKDAFGGRCITAARAQADLVAAGWTAPWQEWGRWERLQLEASRAAPLQPQCAPQQQSCDRGPSRLLPRYPPVRLLPPSRFIFGRPRDKDGDRRGRPPSGQLSSTGDLPDSCITGVEMDSRP